MNYEIHSLEVALGKRLENSEKVWYHLCIHENYFYHAGVVHR